MTDRSRYYNSLRILDDLFPALDALCALLPDGWPKFECDSLWSRFHDLSNELRTLIAQYDADNPD